jgi:hypothetical protein
MRIKKDRKLSLDAAELRAIYRRPAAEWPPATMNF